MINFILICVIIGFLIKKEYPGWAAKRKTKKEQQEYADRLAKWYGVDKEGG